MIIIEIEHVKQIPSAKMRAYSLSKTYTEKEAARDYEYVYRVPPTNGWKWSTYLYFELPEGVK